MSTVKEKIAKLLALSTSPNEKEAQEALLKARELMAKHKLRQEDCQNGADARVIVRTIGVECTTLTDPWAVALGSIIGKRYSCQVFRRHTPGSKKNTVGFAGFEDDFEVCRRIYLYAYECVKARCRRIQASERDKHGVKELRDMCNAFGWGFCYGLETAFQEQEKEHQEWGLVLAVPQAVHDAMGYMGKPTGFGSAQINGWRQKYANAGFAEGKRFDPARQLEPGSKQNKATA